VVPVAFLTTVPAEAMLVVQLGWVVAQVAGAGSLFVARLLAARAFTPVLPAAAEEQGS